jgi:hypothetical protein
VTTPPTDQQLAAEAAPHLTVTGRTALEVYRATQAAAPLPAT